MIISEINTSPQDITSDVENNAKQVNSSVDKSFSVGTKDHAELENLDFEHSGHTGFVPERLSVYYEDRLVIGSEERQQTRLFAYNENGGGCTITMEQIKKMNTKIVNEEDVNINDLSVGDYIFTK